MKLIIALSKSLKNNWPMIVIGVFIITISCYFGYILIEGLNFSKNSFGEILLSIFIVMLIGHFMYKAVFVLISDCVSDFKKYLYDMENKV